MVGSRASSRLLPGVSRAVGLYPMMFCRTNATRASHFCGPLQHQTRKFSSAPHELWQNDKSAVCPEDALENTAELKISQWQRCCEWFLSLVQSLDQEIEIKTLPARSRATFVYRYRGSGEGWVPILFRYTVHVLSNKSTFQNCLDRGHVLMICYDGRKNLMYIKNGLHFEKNTPTFSHEEAIDPSYRKLAETLRDFYEGHPKCDEPLDGIIPRDKDRLRYKLIDSMSRRIYGPLGLPTVHRVQGIYEVAGGITITHRITRKTKTCYQVRYMPCNNKETNKSDFYVMFFLKTEALRGFYLVPQAKRRECLYPPFFKCGSKKSEAVQSEYAQYYIDLENLTDEEAQEKVSVILALNQRT